MLVLGISYSFSGTRPAAIGVLGRGTSEDPQLEQLFSHQGDHQEDWAQALLSLVDKVDSVLGQQPVDLVIVASRDLTHRARVAYVEKWFSIEGALLAVARRRTRHVFAFRGRQIGDRYESKAAAEGKARELVGGDAQTAGAAALAGLVEGKRLGIQ